MSALVFTEIVALLVLAAVLARWAFEDGNERIRRRQRRAARRQGRRRRRGW